MIVAGRRHCYLPGSRDRPVADRFGEDAPLSPAPPIRQLTRLRKEFSIAFAQATAPMFPGRVSLAVEYAAVARVCLPDWTPGGTIARPPQPARAIAAYRLACSLGVPAETMRRRARVLVDRGLLAAVDGGLALATTPAGADFAVAFYRTAHDHFLRMVADIGPTCDVDLPACAPATFGEGDVVRCAIDTVLLPIDTFIPSRISPTAHILWAAFVVIANARVTHDPVLARRYAVTLPPNELRTGLALRRVASSLGIPYTSARRHMAELVDNDLITRLGGDRWAVLVENRHGEMFDIGCPPTVLLLGRLRELARLGLTPARAAEAYLDGRPAIAVF